MSTADVAPHERPTTPPRWAVTAYLVRGALAMVFGAAVLLLGTGLSRLCTFVALYVIGAGAVSLHWAIAHRHGAGERLAIGVGVLWVGAGIALLARGPLQDTIGEGVLLDVLGIVAVATGVIRITGRFHDDQLAGDRPRARYRFVVGPLDVCLGLAVLVADDHSSTGVRLALGVWGLVTATFLVLDGLALRRSGGEHPQARTPRR